MLTSLAMVGFKQTASSETIGRIRRSPPSARISLRNPHLILIMGVAGSGKTTLAKAILRRVQAVYLDNNHIVDAFFPETRNGSAYAKWRPLFYRVLYNITEENLRLGNNVILDVPHVKEMQDPDWRKLIKSLTTRTRSKSVVIRCYCSEELLYARLRLRGEKRDRWKLTHWKKFLKEQRIMTPIPVPHLEVNTEKHLSTNVAKAVEFILSTETDAFR